MTKEMLIKARARVFLALCLMAAIAVVVVLPVAVAQDSNAPAGTPDKDQGQNNAPLAPPQDPNQPPEDTDPAEEDDEDPMLPDRNDIDELYELFGRVFNDQLVSGNGNVDYATLRRKRNDIITISRTLDNLHPLVLMSLTPEERIAFWINTHNICTIRLVPAPPESPVPAPAPSPGSHPVA